MRVSFKMPSFVLQYVLEIWCVEGLKILMERNSAQTVKRTLIFSYICSTKKNNKSYLRLIMRRLILFFCFMTVVSFSQATDRTSKSNDQTNSGEREVLYVAELDSLDDTWSDNLEINADPRVDTLIQINREEFARKGGIEGYRVQIYQGNKESAYQNKARFISRYENIKVYVLFQSPDFKVRVGNFRTRSEALKIRQLIQNDFPATFVVEDIVIPDLGTVVPEANE
jgi:hypothetical protein